MDCDKFEASMLDELYGELDELTLAASKRHVGGCARCSALMAGLRATRKLVTLPVLAPSEGFESRLLLAVQAAEAKAKPRFTLAQVITWAGAWAMRPSTAMAAVFLLIVGTSSVLLSRRAPRSAAETASASFTVTENGAPAASAAPAGQISPGADFPVDPRAAAAAHGLAPAAAAPAAPAPSSALAMAQARAAAEPNDLSSEGVSKSAAGMKNAARMAPGGPAFDEAPGTLGSIGGGRRLGELKGAAESQFSTPPPANQPVAKDDGPFAAGKDQYRQRDYAGAADSFNRAAAGGDQTASLWAARSLRDGADGCPGAVARFDSVASAAWGSPTGYEATFEAAECYARMGQLDAARSRYQRLLTVPAYASRAQAGIGSASPVAAKARAMAKPPAAPAAASPQATAAAAPPAAPPAGPPAK